MVFRKHNSTAGFSLIEVLVAITILGLVVVPIGSSLVLSFRLNARSEQMLQAQLAVSSAVETIMAEGYDSEKTEEEYSEHFGVTIDADAVHSDPDDGESPVVYYKIIVSDSQNLISVDTCVRPAPAEGGEDEG